MLARKLVTIAHVGENKQKPRLWFESSRLNPLGFAPGTRYSLKRSPERITLSPTDLGERRVSSKRGIPIIDLNSLSALYGFGKGESVKVISHPGRIEITPTRRTFHIRDSVKAKSTYRVFEAFCGGGTFHDALKNLDSCEVVGALELEARYLNVFEQKAPNVELYHGNIKDYDPDDLPNHDIFLAGIPCVDHSSEGRAKKGIKGETKPEDCAAGNLYIEILPMIRHHQPLAVVIENVPSYLSSEAGQNLVRCLRQWSYEVTAEVINPIDWGEISERKRCTIIATKRGKFDIRAPEEPHQYRLSDFLDPEDHIQDAIDAERDAHSVRYLADRSKKMEAKGNGWRHQIIDRNHLGRVPSITKGYWRRQPQSWMVRVPYGAGARMLRKHEIARIHGHTFPDNISNTLSTEISGQGVMSRVFRTIFSDLTSFLDANHTGTTTDSPFQPSHEPEQLSLVGS